MINTRGVDLALPLDVVEVGELRRYKITLPFLPPSKNIYDKWSWDWQASCKRKWMRWIQKEVDAQQIPSVAKIGLAAVCVFPTKGRRDLSNYAQPIWNFLPDGLVAAGVIPDDREGRIAIPPNWGVEFAYDLRPGLHKRYRSRTIIGVSMRVANHA